MLWHNAAVHTLEAVALGSEYALYGSVLAAQRPDAPPPVLHAVRMCLSLVTLTVWGTVGGVSRAAGEAFIFAVIIGNALLFILAALLIQPQQATAKAAKH